MVVVSFDQSLHILYTALPPMLFLPYVLPSWNFLKDEQAESIAGIQECRMLWIVAGPNQINPPELFQDACIFLCSEGGGAAYPRKG